MNSSRDRPSIDFYFGLGSRYSYLAATQITRIEAAYDCVFTWKPLASGLLLERRGANPFKMMQPATGLPLSGQYDAAYRAQDARRWAACYGVPFREPAGLPADPTLLARACLAADEQGDLVRMCRAVFGALFVDGVHLDAAALGTLAAALGLDRLHFDANLSSPVLARRHDRLIDEAIGRGIFGVPTFCLGDQLFWGNDRLVLLEAALRGTPMP